MSPKLEAWWRGTIVGAGIILTAYILFGLLTCTIRPLDALAGSVLLGIAWYVENERELQ